VLADSLQRDSTALMIVQVTQSTSSTTATAPRPISLPLTRCAQASPEAADAPETLCSLNFAARVRGVELNAIRRKPDVPASAGRAAVTAAAGPVASDGKVPTALRAALAPNIDPHKGPASAAKNAAALPAARATPRRLEKELDSVTQLQLRRSMDKENSGA
jgi:hypothetical protein